MQKNNDHQFEKVSEIMKRRINSTGFMSWYKTPEEYEKWLKVKHGKNYGKRTRP